MTRQNNEDPAVPQGARKTAPPRDVEPSGGGKGIPVNQQTGQLALFVETAEYSRATAREAVVEAEERQGESATHAVPKSTNKTSQLPPAMMEQVASHLREAFRKVASNRGAPGPDGKTVAEVREQLDTLIPALSELLVTGTYHPGTIRRVWLPKPGGGQRGLGIPDVIDRMVQEAVRMVLEPLYEPRFHPSSHGFRPGRSCQTAIKEAQGYVADGFEWVVDLDLKSFFDQVCHQRLLSHLAQRVADRRVLKLIGRWLRADVVMPDGVRVSTDTGVPQGGPLSPLLSNIVLDELDRELYQRRHRFVRYADDCNIYVRSERAGQRVKASITSFIERRLRLEVNEAKSAVARTGERHFVGFTLRQEPMEGDIEIGLSKRSRERLNARVRELTPRNWGQSLEDCIRKLNEYLTGWFGFFKICTSQEERTYATVDAHIRRRLRAILLTQWKRKRTIARKLIQLGVKRTTAWRRVYAGRKSKWALSHDPAVNRGLRNAYFAKRGFVFLVERYRKHLAQVVAPAQLMLALG